MDTLPELLAKVRLHHRLDVYLVLDVNWRQRTVELLSITGEQDFIPNVPVAAIRELVEPSLDYL